MTLRILLVMDPFIPVPPEHYGGIERRHRRPRRRLHRRGHRVTLWAAPGSTTLGACEPFGQVGEWTRSSNARNVALLTGRFWRQPDRFDLVQQLRSARVSGRHSPVGPSEGADLHADGVARNMRLARVLGARRLHYTAVSAAIRDTGRPGGGDWSVIYNLRPRRPVQVPHRRRPRRGAPRIPRAARFAARAPTPPLPWRAG